MTRPWEKSKTRASDTEYGQRLPADVVAFTRVFGVALAVSEKADGTSLEGNDIVLKLRFGDRGRQASIVLTSLTADEVKALDRIWRFAVDRALPIAQARDRQAMEALEAGDDSFTRLYRQVPIVTIREGKKS